MLIFKLQFIFEMEFCVIIKTVSAVFMFLLFCVSAASTQKLHTYFVKGKTVATSHTTLRPYSQIQCVNRCVWEARNGHCSVAGYNKTAQSCHLSIGSQQDVFDDADQSVGVFYVHQETIGEIVLFRRTNEYISIV